MNNSFPIRTSGFSTNSDIEKRGGQFFEHLFQRLKNHQKTEDKPDAGLELPGKKLNHAGGISPSMVVAVTGTNKIGITAFCNEIIRKALVGNHSHVTIASLSSSPYKWADQIAAAFANIPINNLTSNCGEITKFQHEQLYNIATRIAGTKEPPSLAITTSSNCNDLLNATSIGQNNIIKLLIIDSIAGLDETNGPPPHQISTTMKAIRKIADTGVAIVLTIPVGPEFHWVEPTTISAFSDIALALESKDHSKPSEFRVIPMKGLSGEVDFCIDHDLMIVTELHRN